MATFDPRAYLSPQRRGAYSQVVSKLPLSGTIPVARTQPAPGPAEAVRLQENRLGSQPVSSFSGSGAAFVPVDRAGAPPAVANPAVVQTMAGPTVQPTGEIHTMSAPAQAAVNNQDTIFHNQPFTPTAFAGRQPDNPNIGPMFDRMAANVETPEAQAQIQAMRDRREARIAEHQARDNRGRPPVPSNVASEVSRRYGITFTPEQAAQINAGDYSYLATLIPQTATQTMRDWLSRRGVGQQSGPPQGLRGLLGTGG